MVGQLKLAVAQSLQSPGHAQSLLDVSFQLPYRCGGVAIEAKLRARECVNVKAKCVHAEMAACIQLIFTDDVQACGVNGSQIATTTHREEARCHNTVDRQSCVHYYLSRVHYCTFVAARK